MNKTDKIIALSVQVKTLTTVIASAREDHAKVEDSLRTCKLVHIQQAESIGYKTKLITDLSNEAKTGRKIIAEQDAEIASLKQHIASLPILAKPKMYEYVVKIQTSIPDLDDAHKELELALSAVEREADISIIAWWEGAKINNSSI